MIGDARELRRDTDKEARARLQRLASTAGPVEWRGLSSARLALVGTPPGPRRTARCVAADGSSGGRRCAYHPTRRRDRGPFGVRTRCRRRDCAGRGSGTSRVCACHGRVVYGVTACRLQCETLTVNRFFEHMLLLRPRERYIHTMEAPRAAAECSPASIGTPEGHDPRGSRATTDQRPRPRAGPRPAIGRIRQRLTFDLLNGLLTCRRGARMPIPGASCLSHGRTLEGVAMTAHAFDDGDMGNVRGAVEDELLRPPRLISRGRPRLVLLHHLHSA